MLYTIIRDADLLAIKYTGTFWTVHGFQRLNAVALNTFGEVFAPHVAVFIIPLVK